MVRVRNKLEKGKGQGGGGGQHELDGISAPSLLPPSPLSPPRYLTVYEAIVILRYAQDQSGVLSSHIRRGNAVEVVLPRALVDRHDFLDEVG